jgi:hypothetical protein
MLCSKTSCSLPINKKEMHILGPELGTRFFLGFALELSRSWGKLFALFFWP